MFALEAPRAMPPPAQCVPQQAWRDGSASTGERILAEEVPVAFSYDGVAHAVLMATPDDLEDFALGFSHTEGIITAPAEIAELAVVAFADGIVLRMWLTGDRSDAFAARRRRFVGPAGCGMCGLESLAEANRTIPVVSCDLRVSRQDIAEAVAAMPARQQLNMQTQAVHAAAFWEPRSGPRSPRRRRTPQRARQIGGRIAARTPVGCSGHHCAVEPNFHRACAKSRNDRGVHHSWGICADGVGGSHCRVDRPHPCRRRTRRRVRGVHAS